MGGGCLIFAFRREPCIVEEVLVDQSFIIIYLVIILWIFDCLDHGNTEGSQLFEKARAPGSLQGP